MPSRKQPSALFGDSIGKLQGTPALQMDPALLEGVTDHLEHLRDEYIKMGWAKRSGCELSR
eukprot:SAG11_NODE_4903_length_1728_cov_2.362799_3_plen_61_part_00